jgi:hypothetical protein
MQSAAAGYTSAAKHMVPAIKFTIGGKNEN